MNTVSLIGRLTRDPEIQYTGTGKAYLRFSIAVQREEDREKADFINCIAWEKRAETIAQYFTKGSRIVIEGRIQTSSYETKDGEKRISTDILISKFHFLDNETEHKEKNKKDYVPKNKKKAVEEEDDDYPF
ncbi:single-stranded DNA-binding protein [Streptobacillus moniliformis]|uniref:single-stranded DNA-binding protein n=1 Tax=Streptobacillus moniliformis TaxID=34105 RepID=UPI0007E2E119|nr:single-stranded DNA-binding protein [Streptobacillus moniliformis]